MTATQQYAPPEIYLNNLRATIGQQWQNGLPVIADLLAKQDFPASLAVIEETVDALLKSQHRGQSWQPETSLLFTIVDGSGNNHGHWQNEKTLLCYYQQTAAGLGQTERIQALKIQQIVFDSCFDWSVILETFTNIPIAVEIHQSLFSSWRDYVVRRAKPQSRWDLYTTVKTVDNWWLHWLINSAAASDPDATGFQAQILQWLTNLPENKGELGEAYDILRLLTKDLTEIYSQTQPPYPQFYQVVIRPRDMSSRDDTFRKKYLQQYAPNDLWDQVMAYWKTQLHNFVPRPELSRNSD